MRYDERQAKRLVSRGQQKLLACSMIIAATEIVQTHWSGRCCCCWMIPAAELDRDSLGRLMAAIQRLGARS